MKPQVRLAAIGLTLLGAAVSGYAFELNLNKVFGILEKATKLQSVDEPKEIEIGKGVASGLVGAAPLVRDEKMLAYVNRVGAWLAQHTERPGLPWRFGVLDTPNVNAFATPGGYIFVTRGLMERMGSEAELAGVLAHEMAHVLKRHHLNAIQKSAAVGIGADIASIALSQNNRNSEAFDRLIGVGLDLYAKGLDKDDELEADRMGVVIAARAGYDPYGLPAVLQTLEAINPEDGAVALMFKTHPSPRARLDALAALMTPALDAYAGQAELAGRFRTSVGERR